MSKIRNYLHYVPEFNTLVIMGRRYKKYYRDAFQDGLKGTTPMVLIAVDYFGFQVW